MKSTYKDDIQIGEALTYHPGGKVMFKENYENGKLEGLRIVYDESGKEISRNWFSGGRMLTKEEEEKYIIELQKKNQQKTPQQKQQPKQTPNGTKQGAK